MHPELGEGALVDQEREALAGGQLVAPVLLGDLLGAAAGPDRLPTLLEILNERAQRRPRLGLENRELALGAARRRDHRPLHTGSRFSKKALTPSTTSSVEVASESCARR